MNQRSGNPCFQLSEQSPISASGLLKDRNRAGAPCFRVIEPLLQTIRYGIFLRGCPDSFCPPPKTPSCATRCGGRRLRIAAGSSSRFYDRWAKRERPIDQSQPGGTFRNAKCESRFAHFRLAVWKAWLDSSTRWVARGICLRSSGGCSSWLNRSPLPFRSNRSPCKRAPQLERCTRGSNRSVDRILVPGEGRSPSLAINPAGSLVKWHAFDLLKC